MITEKKVSSIKRLRPLCDRAEGFSLIELLVVISVIAIVTGIAVFQFTNTREAYNADDAAYKVMNYFREANSRAVSGHHSCRVTINNSTSTISLIDEQRFAAITDGENLVGPAVLVKSEPLGVRVSLAQPLGVNPPPFPFNYAAATYASNVWTGHFQSIGSVTDVNGNPQSCTFFFQPTNSTNLLNLIRAVTVFGPSGSIRFWMYNGTQMVQG
jgi:prepilin-type N-terminal cleavage/methylation domain-containing protein